MQDAITVKIEAVQVSSVCGCEYLLLTVAGKPHSVMLGHACWQHNEEGA